MKTCDDVTCVDCGRERGPGITAHKGGTCESGSVATDPTKLLLIEMDCLRHALSRERARVGTLEKANEMLEEDRRREKARADAAEALAVRRRKEADDADKVRERYAVDCAIARKRAETAEAALAAARRELQLCQLFVLGAHWLLSGLQRDVDASEPAVLLYTPLRMAALRTIKAFHPPGTVRSFTCQEGVALSELVAAAESIVQVPRRPLGGETGEWWRLALRSLSLPSIPFGDEMKTLRAALAAPAAGEEGKR